MWLSRSSSSVSEWSGEEGALHLVLLLLLHPPALQLQSVHLLLHPHSPNLIWRSRRSRGSAQCGEEAGHGYGAPQPALWLRLQSPSSSSVLPCTATAPQGQRSAQILVLSFIISVMFPGGFLLPSAA